MLTLDQAHALVEFSAAHERAQRTEYRPTNADIAAARTGYQQLEAALRQERPAAVPPPPITAGVASAAPAADVPAEPVTVRRRGFPLIALIALLLLLGGLGGGIYYFMTRQSNESLQRGIQAYTSGNRTEARNAFAEAVRDDPNDAEPHIYLARMAREEGDAQNAVRELETAIKLEPANGLAQREMGAHLLTKSTAELNAGNLPAALQSIDLARRFFARAVENNPNDRVAMGWLGCSLMRLGRVPEAQRFYARAGQGDWSQCTPLPTLAPQPGAAPPVR
jgi:tetratricopeptide (TPR) repeat protein